MEMCVDITSAKGLHLVLLITQRPIDDAGSSRANVSLVLTDKFPRRLQSQDRLPCAKPLNARRHGRDSIGRGQ